MVFLLDIASRALCFQFAPDEGLVDGTTLSFRTIVETSLLNCGFEMQISGLPILLPKFLFPFGKLCFKGVDPLAKNLYLLPLFLVQLIDIGIKLLKHFVLLVFEIVGKFKLKNLELSFELFVLVFYEFAMPIVLFLLDPKFIG